MKSPSDSTKPHFPYSIFRNIKPQTSIPMIGILLLSVCLASTINIKANLGPSSYNKVLTGKNEFCYNHDTFPYKSYRPKCGNCILDEDEECDFGSHIWTGGMNGQVIQCPYQMKQCMTCSDKCTIDYSLSRVSYCGDGIVQAQEECDDGNNMRGDGCNEHCQFECRGKVDLNHPRLFCKECPKGMRGKYCTERNCLNGVVDYADENGECLFCFPGWTGEFCRESRCVNGIRDMKCPLGSCSECKAGFSGRYCEIIQSKNIKRKPQRKERSPPESMTVVDKNDSSNETKTKTDLNPQTDSPIRDIQINQTIVQPTNEKEAIKIVPSVTVETFPVIDSSPKIDSLSSPEINPPCQVENPQIDKMPSSKALNPQIDSMPVPESTREFGKFDHSESLDLKLVLLVVCVVLLSLQLCKSTRIEFELKE